MRQIAIFSLLKTIPPEKRVVVYNSFRFTTLIVRDRLQISLLILRDFKIINSILPEIIRKP